MDCVQIVASHRIARENTYLLSSNPFVARISFLTSASATEGILGAYMCDVINPVTSVISRNVDANRAFRGGGIDSRSVSKESRTGLTIDPNSTGSCFSCSAGSPLAGGRSNCSRWASVTGFLGGLSQAKDWSCVYLNSCSLVVNFCRSESCCRRRLERAPNDAASLGNIRVYVPITLSSLSH